MSVSGNSFLKFADWLQEQESCNDEIKFRTCVNRAYYCIFHITKEFLLEKFLIVNRKASHREVIEQLKLEDELLGDKLYDFFEQRKEADYILGVDLNKKRAERLVKEMAEFPQALNEEDSMTKI
jgi:uncharacterized protein (UPF0332 family)